jgi:glycosyltransferase involved in cell wall biosynthesis
MTHPQRRINERFRGAGRARRLLLLSMYPLDAGSWGPTVRIRHLRDELASLAELEVVHGYRSRRRAALAAYALSGRLRGLGGIYVESSSFLPAEADIAFLALARTLGIRVLTFVRDAYQLFPEYYQASGSVRRWLGARAFLPATRTLLAVSSRSAFPSAGLARAVLGRTDQTILIPPGAPAPISVPMRAGARRLLFVGNGRLPAQGADRLIAAVERARGRGAGVELTIVSRPGEEPVAPSRPWLRVVNAEGPAILELLPDVIATVIPRPRGPYNDLAIPVKLFDYLAWGRPLLVTDCTEQAAIVARAGCGLITTDGVAEMGDAIVQMTGASAATRNAWSEAAHRAAREQSWAKRANQIVSALFDQ